MTRENTELSTLVEAVRAGHEELDHRVEELRRACAAIRSGADPGVDVKPLVEAFQDDLLLHFAEEELEETFGSLLTEQPRLLHRVDRLQQEHGDMAEAVNRLIALASSEGVGLDLAARIDRLLDWLALHERAENALMQELVLLDEGGSGD